LVKKQKKTVGKKNYFIDFFFLFVILWCYKNGIFFLKKHIFPRFLPKNKFTTKETIAMDVYTKHQLGIHISKLKCRSSKQTIITKWWF
jgi:hypothetical protein